MIIEKCTVLLHFFEHHDNIFIFLKPLTIVHSNIIYHQQSASKIDHILPFKEETDAIMIDTKQIIFIAPLIQVENYVCTAPYALHKVL